jgi:hypothetical protein
MSIPVTCAFVSVESLEKSGGYWLSIKDYVSIAIDEYELVEGPFSYRFSSTNVTGWMTFDFETGVPSDFSGKFLAMWLKLQSVDLEPSLRLTLYDINGNHRGFWDFATQLALEPAVWARLVIDVDDFQWEDADFDLAKIVKMRFGVYNEGIPYSQTVWIEAPSLLLVGENPSPVSSTASSIDFSLILSVLLLLFICYCAGFNLFHLCKLDFPSSFSLAISLPIYIVTGLVSLIVLTSLLCLVYFDVVVSWSVFSAIVITFVLLLKKNWGDFRMRMREVGRRESLFSTILFGFSLVVFLRIALDMGWGAYVHSQTHGLYTSLILFRKGFPYTSYPVGEMSLSPIRYPMGFHALCAFNSFLTGIYPGKGLLIVATALVSFLPSLFYSIVGLYTNSSKLSLFAFLLSFFLPGFTPVLWMASHDLLLGNFLVGSYPNLLGNVVMMAFFAFIAFGVRTKISLRHSSFVYVLLITSLFFGYYSLLPYLAFFTFLELSAFLFGRSGSKSALCATSLVLLFTLLLVICSVFFYRESLLNFFNLDSSLLYNIYMRYGLFELSSPYIIYTLLIFVAFPFSLWFLTRGNLKDAGLLFFSAFIPLMVAQNEQLYTSFLWFIQPDRALILLVIFSYAVLLLGVAELSKLGVFRGIQKPIHLHFTKHSFSPNWITMSLILLVLVPSLLSCVTYSYPDRYKSCLPNGNDFRALAWLAENTTSELILNDRTIIGLWATSFKALEVINDREIILNLYLFRTLNDTLWANRTYEANRILDYPYDYDLVIEITRKYNITYIYISECDQPLYERGQPISPSPWSHLSQEERILTYQLNPNLEIAFRSGNAVIFKVVK